MLNHRDGRINVGDEILFINGYSLIGVSHQDAIHLLRAAKNPIQIVVSQDVRDVCLYTFFSLIFAKIKYLRK